jgi:hypothetical protein
LPTTWRSVSTKLPGSLPAANGRYALSCAVIVKRVDAKTRATLAAQVQQSNAVAAKYPTVAAAEAAGWHRITPYVPCIAAHYIKGGALGNPFDPSEPEILLFDGTEPDSKLVGLSYLVFAHPEQPPDGFAGGNNVALREVATPFVALLGNDACWNAESQIQLREYGRERQHGCALTPARYDLAVAALGGHGELVDNADDLPGAIERALASRKPACINVMIESIAAPLIRLDS